MDLKTFVKLNLCKYLTQMKLTGVIHARVAEHVAMIETGEIDVYQTFCCDVPMDLLYLSDFSPYMGHLLLLEPNLIRDAIADLVKLCLKRELPPKTNLLANQVSTQVVISPIAHMLPPYPAAGLCSVRGVIVVQTLPRKFVRTSRWKCIASICTSLPPFVAKGLPTKPPLCNHCAAPLEELPTKRAYGVKVTAEISDSAASHYLNKGIYQNTSICIVDDKSKDREEFHLGEEINCWGVREDDTLLVWGWEKKCPPPMNISPYWKIEILRRQLECSPWAFVQSLASSIGGRTFPPNKLMHLRTGLLLSLASLNSAQPISILATNHDTTISQKLMFEATQAAPICCLHSVSPCLGGYIKQDTWYAGTILRASRGVCYLGDWYSYQERKGDAARNAIESGRVVFEGGSGEYLPMRTAIWTYKNNPVGKRETEKQETLLKIFGLNWTTTVASDMEEEVISCLFNQGGLVPQASMDELREYIEAVNTRPVQLSNGALDLLQQYFVCARRIRDNGLPVRSLDLLITMTEAHARLNQRPLAYPEDAIATIYLCEHSMVPSYAVPDPPQEIWLFADWLQEHVLSIV